MYPRAVVPFVVMAFAAAWWAVFGQSDDRGTTITSRQPLAEAADVLEERYGKPVTYESPIWTWRGDLGPSEKLEGIFPILRSFILPPEADPARTAELDQVLLDKVVVAHNQQTDGPRFTTLSSRLGLHIVPSEVRDANGRFVRVTPVMDTVIDVPAQARTPVGHLAAICEALATSNRAGFDVRPSLTTFDQYFAPNGIIIPRIPTPQDQERISFAWGATRITAREAVIGLLDQSSTTMSWRFLCQADEPVCFFSVYAVQTIVTGPDGIPVKKALSWDRCGSCPSSIKVVK